MQAYDFFKATLSFGFNENVKVESRGRHENSRIDENHTLVGIAF